MKKTRYNELKRILEERRFQIMAEVQDKMRDVRKENATVPQQGVRDEAESSEADIQEDIEFALLQMKAETLKKIDDALLLLDKDYGRCRLRYVVSTVKRNVNQKHQLTRRMVHCVARYHYSWITQIDTELVPRSLCAKCDVF